MKKKLKIQSKKLSLLKETITALSTKQQTKIYGGDGGVGGTGATGGVSGVNCH
ncbi:MAG TPA: class I lanthipeptide [Bacteroidia bacterium]|jgi:hypothetical protein|nr:class I lanthipeptide [Bacteroidia bacterium]